MASRKKGSAQEMILHRKLVDLWKRGQSRYCEVRGSDIHGRGVYATTFIPKETRIVEYVGERVDKEESERRAWKQMEKAEREGAVYIFTLSKRWDIDGNVPWNTARLINHSCDPNCEAWIEGRRIFLYALRDIEAGEELGFDYGFDVENYEDHPCRCGSDGCVGYIVSREQWPELRKRLEEEAGAGDPLP
jgi:SET domain-containing protein